MQESFGYIREDAINWFSKGLTFRKQLRRNYFYVEFTLAERQNIITACCGTACHVSGSGPIISKIRKS
jgi:NADH:ubiquinone oxidoreductase subunit E